MFPHESDWNLYLWQVDVRDVSTGEPVPFAESNGKYLVKVEPLNAVRSHSNLYYPFSHLFSLSRRCEMRLGHALLSNG
jgi:hypothetical protein